MIAKTKSLQMMIRRLGAIASITFLLIGCATAPDSSDKDIHDWMPGEGKIYTVGGGVLPFGYRKFSYRLKNS